MLRIEALSKEHDRKSFDCGNKQLNEFFQKTARQHADRGISRTFVLVDDELPIKVMAYYTLTSCDVIPQNIPDKRLQRYPRPIPAAKLARLAVLKAHQKNGHGRNMLIDAMKRTLTISENIGIVGMFVDAKDGNAAHYYQRFGFTPIETNPLLLFLPMATIRKSFED